MKTRNSRKAGFTLVEIMIVVAIIGLLAAIAIPNFVQARTQSQMTTCINNLRQIDSSIQQFATEQNCAATTSVVFSDISVYMQRSVVCPAGGSSATFNTTYSISDCQTKPTCLIVSSTHILPN